MPIGTNLKKYRKKCGLTLQALADKVDSSKSYIWELENDHSIPSVLKAYDLAKALEIRIEDLIGKKLLKSTTGRPTQRGV